MKSFKDYILLNESNNNVEFSKLLYIDQSNFTSIIEFKINNKFIIYYNGDDYKGFDESLFQQKYNKSYKISNKCIIEKQKDLSYLFMNTPITKFDKDLPNVENTESMFQNCINLEIFRSNMPKLKKHNDMFKGCSDNFFNKYRKIDLYKNKVKYT